MLRKIIKTIILVFCCHPLLLAAQPQPDYVFLLNQEQGDLYIDQKNIIQPDKNKPLFYVRILIQLREEHEGVVASESINQIDCKDQTSRMVAIMTRDAQGQILGRIDDIDGTRFSSIPINPGSPLWDFVCRSEN